MVTRFYVLNGRSYVQAHLLFFSACNSKNFTGVTSGSIESPNYPSGYPDLMSCRYYIYAPPATPVSVIIVSDVNYILLSR